MTELLPKFRYHPDAVSTESVAVSDVVCMVCNRARGYIYTGPVFSDIELNEQVCPWCIGDGSANRLFGAEFVDRAGVGGYGTWESVPEHVINELVTRTPCFTGWQQERWFTCCGDGAAFIGRAGRRELHAAGPDAMQSVRSEAGYEGQDWEEYLELLDANGSPTAYLFRCIRCGRVGGYSDCH